MCSGQAPTNLSPGASAISFDMPKNHIDRGPEAAVNADAYALFRCSPGSQLSPSRQVRDFLQSAQMRWPGHALIKSFQHLRQQRRFRVCLRSDLGLRWYGE